MRYLLLKKAREAIKGNEAINFVFAGINCSLGVKLNNAPLNIWILMISFLMLLTRG